MKKEKHNDRLKDQLSESEENPEVYVFKSEEAPNGITRREFLARSLAMPAAISLGAAAALASSGCKKDTLSDFKSLHLMQHQGSVNCLAISPDGTILASGSSDKTIKLWELPAGRLLNTLEGHSSDIVSLAINPNGTLLVSAERNGKIKFWNLPGGSLVKTISGEFSNIYNLGVSPDGQVLIVGGHQPSIKIFSMPDGNYMNFIEMPASNTYSCLAISKDSQQIAVGTDEGKILFYSLPGGELLTGSMNPSTSKILELTFSPDGKMIAVGSLYHINIYQFPETTGLGSFEGNLNDINSLIFSPDGSTVYTTNRRDLDHYGFPDMKIRIRNVPDGAVSKVIQVYSEFESFINDLALSPDGTILAAGLDDKTIRLWSLPSGNAITTPCTCDQVCTCDTVCSSVSVCTCDGNSGGTYWYPS
jgi:WD40 repeat protein